MLLTLATLLLQVAAPSRTETDAEQAGRRAQSRFEAIRRMSMPRLRSNGPPEPCRIIIGRLCYWHDASDARRIPDPGPVVAARTRLVATLDSLAQLEPRNDWIAGQRVRYLIESARWDDAIAAAGACAGERWWCAALRGTALHVAQRDAEADAAFATALAALPSGDRCTWTDLRSLVWPRVARELAGADCAQRAVYANRLWTLAQPMWTMPGNDVRTEHFARQIMVRIQADAAGPQEIAFPDLRESMIRYGWPAWYSRDDDLYATIFTEPSVSSHDREPSFAVFPDIASVRVGRVSPGDWHLRTEVAPARYAPRHVSAMLDLPHQLVRFSRGAGDSMRVVITYALTDTLLAGDDLHVAAASWAGGAIAIDSSLATPKIAAGRISGVAEIVIPNQERTISVELYGARTHRLARARYTIDRLDPRGGLSDLLLFDPGAASGNVIDAALTSAQFPADRPLGLAWQLYAPGMDDLHLRVRLEPIHVSGARRLAARLRLARGLDVVSVRWPVSGSDSTMHSTILHLPANTRGRHRITLSLEGSGGTIASSSRELELIPDR